MIGTFVPEPILPPTLPRTFFFNERDFASKIGKVLTSAEHVLSIGGIDDFTVAAVAEHAGMSVGAIYRRFSGKEQLLKAVKDLLLERLESEVTDALHSAAPSLRGTIDAFTRAMARTFSGRTSTFPELLSGQPVEGIERGLQALETIQRALVESTEPYLDDVARPEPQIAVRFVARSIIGSCVHRAATCQSWSDGLSWTAWAVETTEMAIAYLTSCARADNRGRLSAEY